MSVTQARGMSRGLIGPWRAGLLAVIVAVVGNVVVYVLARALGVSMMVPISPAMPPEQLPITMVIAASLIGGAGGTLVFSLLRRLPGRGERLFLLVGAAVFLLSLGAPLSQPQVDGLTKFVLIMMHFVSGGATVGLLSRFGGRPT